MPTALRSGSYRFAFFAHEPPGEPPHIHVTRDRDQAKLWLDPVRLYSSRGFSDREIGVILSIVREHRTHLLRAWHDFSATR